MTDQQRVAAAIVLFVIGSVVTATISVIAGMILMVLGLAALLWGRSVGDNRPSRDDRS